MQQAALFAEMLDVVPTLLLSSTYVRAVATARPFSEKTSRPITPHSLLHEFSTLDAALLQGMTVERRPIADAFWNQADPDLRHGPASETFREFSGRMARFESEMPHLPRDTVLFGHGIGFALLSWKLRGFSADDATGMREFRRFQSALPMPNCAVYGLEQSVSGVRRLQAKRRSCARSPLWQRTGLVDERASERNRRPTVDRFVGGPASVRNGSSRHAASLVMNGYFLPDVFTAPVATLSA